MPAPTERTDIELKREKAVLAAARLPNSNHNPADPFGEIQALAEQAGARIVGMIDQRIDKPNAGTYMGKGKIEELKALCAQTGATTVIFDHELSPKQIAAIEKAVERKVLDRSEVILDIFASRASSHEAKLQVELAQLDYTYPRLRAMWSHLERIAGGAPAGIGTRGPGEQQLEIDRRIVQRKRAQLLRELKTIQDRKSRMVQERNAKHRTIGLVGYTNAGKSTLFNTLTEGGAYADDRVFATLMTRTRAWDLGGGDELMLSDTVGFVRDLPHHLVASFRATLEEATHADLLLIVLDVSDPAADLHLRTVRDTLDSLFDDLDAPAPPQLLLLNKADRLPDNRELLIWQSREPDSITISALPSDEDPHQLRMGHDELLGRVRDALRGEEVERTVRVKLSSARTIAALEQKAEVLGRDYGEGEVTLTVRARERLLHEIVDPDKGAEVLDAPKSQRPGWAGLG